ncbi:palmitoleoyl-protein carboxylesterase notum1'-like [Argopecten irradians]|uniref:palmitoleoyl-protein carboxylesterase notum1'-like n=1 Tax=Argopecten irradians TaxID=31199 RepID=UPI0037176E02
MTRITSSLAWVLVLLPFIMCRPERTLSRHDMALDVNKLERLGRVDTLMKSLKDIAQKSHNCGLKEIPRLQRQHLKNASITCNDGSRAGYYIRKSYGSKRWIVFLEGGWYCFDRPSCQLRWESKHMRSLMSSLDWPEIRAGTGILSWDPKENPYYFNANIVVVPYCSSDSWTGTSRSSEGYAFLGSYIVEAVIRELIPKGLQRARRLMLAGSSAGGTGVLTNLDRVADLMSKLAPNVEVRGIADSGWFVDTPQYHARECTEPFSCAPADGIKRGINLWKGQVPEACKAQYPESEHWKCYFGYRIYPTLKTPIFIVQYLFDEAQITVNNLIDQSQLAMNRGNTVFSRGQWEYLHNLGEHVKSTLQNVTAVFAPACLSHELLQKSTWQSVSVEGVNLAQSIYCWENSFDGEKCLSATRNNRIRHRALTDPLLKDEPAGSNNVTKKRKQRRREKKRRNRKRKNRKRKNKKRRRRQKKKKNKKNNKKDRGRRRSGRSAKQMANCSHHLIELCPLPQWCNGFCPAFRNRFTGEEMDFFKLFAVSGIDRASIAEILGVDQSALNSMNIDTISELLLDTFRHQSS